ncbi:MAG: VCBS repeat-containing protein [Ignavibacteriae bacterium]|nr:VCBS repeat-containing protein [Ignavibacteriota bacterium]
MKKSLLLFFAAALLWSFAGAQVRLASKYSFPLRPSPATSLDSLLNELKSIRGCAFATDVDGDNRSEIAVTSYGGAGGVAVFEAIGNDSIRMVWNSPRVASGGGGSTPRFVLFGDLDNDNKKEVIYQSNSNGIMIFEWDGVTGSDNYGTAPSQIIGTPFITNVTGNCEYMEVGDVDGDGQQELLVAYNSSTNDGDKYYVISGVGDWTTGDPGFSSFNVDYTIGRTQAGASAYSLGGSPVAIIAANFDGTGNKEILIHNWNLKNIVAPIRVTGANTFVMPDTLTGKQNLLLGTTAYDDVALFGGMAYDIDGDGREEVYLPTYPSTGTINLGIVHMISYNTGENIGIIDTTRVTRLSHAALAGTGFGYGYGDIDNDAKKQIYITGAYPNNVMTIEFQGGDKRNPANWVASVLYRGDSTIYTAITYRDSLGTRDTIKTVDPSFASKIHGRNTDLDRDGREDIILPYQALSDSVTYRALTWNVSLSKYDTVLTKTANPKRWSLRVIERDPSAGVEVKNLTVISPDDYKLEQNYPNPFNPSTTIGFFLPIRDKISLKVYDVVGREVRTLISNEEFERGTSRIVWDGKDNSGKLAASGTYFYTLRFGNFEKTSKMLLVK